ncbi:MAG: KTSC domain-containing protein [Candidatus ainarchaeum sp.]|nr:KTSC domain-containing protein [Candidatus ainarchaeum sp.]
MTVKSSRIKAVFYYEINKKAYIKFTNDVVYVYNNVSQDVFNMFIESPSLGKAIYLLGENYYELQ